MVVISLVFQIWKVLLTLYFTIYTKNAIYSKKKIQPSKNTHKIHCKMDITNIESYLTNLLHIMDKYFFINKLYK